MEDDRNKENCVKLQMEETLLPGIPCDITLTKIIPKLSWRDAYTLSSVNRVWNCAVRTRQVYNMSSQFGSTVTCFLGHHYNTAYTISLYSMGEKKWYKLPPLPDVCFNHYVGRIEIPVQSKCVSMDGKIYVIGGRNNNETWNRVFVFDVAAGGKWEACASMKTPRQQFACAVKDGKIYVFGGQTTEQTSLSMRERDMFGPLRSAEVYDPDKNVWSSIKPMNFCRSCDSNFTMVLGDEILVHIGGFFATYHPLKNQWRVVRHPSAREWGIHGKFPFVAQGKAYVIRSYGKSNHMYVSSVDDIHKNLWTRCYPFSQNDLLPSHKIDEVVTILYVKDELLAIVASDTDSNHEQRQSLYQSKGFGDKNQEISWELRDLAFAGPYVPFTRWNYFTVKLGANI